MVWIIIIFIFFLSQGSYFFVCSPSSQQGSVEYAQLNHDADHHGDHSVQDDKAGETDNTADQGECEHDPAPDCDWSDPREYLFPYLSSFVLNHSPTQPYVLFCFGFFVPLYTENIPHCKFTCSACEGWINSFCSVRLFRYMGVSHLDTQRGYMTPPLRKKKKVSLSAYPSTGGSSDTIWIWSKVFEVSRVAV